jgi:pyruvate dehydrogenase E2 component (dihydrolipoamide acetyltransferase)
MAMEAFDEGILSEILVAEGGKAEIGATLAVLREEGEEPETAEPSDEKPVSDPLENLKPVAVGAKIPDPLPEPTPEPEPTPDPAPEPITVSEPAPAAASSERIKASPLARKMAESSGVDLASVKGTGPGGRIVKKDIEAATAGAAAPAPTPVPAPAPAPTPTPSPTPTPAAAVVASGEDQRIELSNLRRIIAERLLTSKTTIPHFYLHVEADAAPLMDIRKQVNAQAEVTHGNKYTVNDFVLKAVINALQAVPAVNASFNGDHIVQFGHIGVAVAIAVDDGLVTPVVKDAALKSLLQISREVKDLATRAREGKLLPNEFDGGTITVSNLGAYGVESFDAIINPPQAAILSIGAIIEKAVVVKGEIVPGLRLDLGLSCDHRVVDGAIGAQFLGQLKKLIENPALMLV